jgi:hypothetical protein
VRSQSFFNTWMRERHGQELIPTREVANAVVADVALDAAAKLFGVNPFNVLGENRFSGSHFDSVALSLLRKNRKRSSSRSHLNNPRSLFVFQPV